MIQINKQEYKDSFQFLSESLDTLVKALRKSNYDVNILKMIMILIY